MSNKTSWVLALLLMGSSMAIGAPTIGVNPPAIATTETGTVQITATGVMGTSVILRLYVDANGNGLIDPPADYVIWTDVVADNVADWSPNMFSDTNVAVGAYTVDVRLFSPLEFPYTAGSYIWEAEDSQNASTDTTMFSVTQTTQVQSVSGTVRDSSTTFGVPGAFVVLLPFCDGGDEADRVYSTFADENGAFTIQVPADVACRNRIVLGAKPGYLTPFAQLPNVFLDGTSQFTLQDPGITAGTWTVTGNLQYSSGALTGSGIPGAFMLANFGDGPPLMSIAFTDENGDYSFELDDGAWDVEAPEDGISTRGAVHLQDLVSVNVSGGSTSFPTLSLPAANAYFEGTLRDDGGLPVAGRWVGAFRNDACGAECYDSSTLTRADGTYSIGVIGPTPTATYGYQLDAFIAAVEEGAPYFTNPGDAVNQMRTIDRCYEAAGLPLRGLDL